MEPLVDLDRKSLQLNFMRNLEREIMAGHGNSRMKREWKNIPNWAKVRLYLNQGTSKAGSTSSIIQCQFLGVKPDGKSFWDMIDNP